MSCAVVHRRLERVDAVGGRALFDGWRGAVLMEQQLGGLAVAGNGHGIRRHVAKEGW